MSDIYKQRRSRRPKRLSRLTKGVSSTVAIFLLFLAAIIVVGQATKDSPVKINDDITAEKLEKVVLPDDINEILIEYTGFNVSFNPAHHVPNYVAWELTGEETKGDSPRKSKFRVDKDVFGCATLDDYRRSGYDRGHMAPAGDMKWSEQAMDDSHYLTNIVPQDHSINGGIWSSLEKLCRQWAVRDSALIIICGPVLTDIKQNIIGESGVSVPDRLFKVVLSPYTKPPRAIGFIFPNSPTDDGLEAISTSVDNIEAITGFDFFDCLPDDVENEIESSTNYRVWTRQKR